jgi:lipopolysaccharide biosynthesis regulator YciM
MTDTGLLAILLTAIAGVLAGRAWAQALRRSESGERPAFRTSPHYTQGLAFLAAGQVELAISELTKVSREDPSALEVLLVLGNLLRERGQVERAIQVHSRLLERGDLLRGERVHALACLGMDFRKAGFLDRATETFGEVLALDARNLQALSGMLKLHEEQRQWREAYELQTRLSRLRKTDDSLVLGFLQAKLGEEAARAGQLDIARKAFQTALSLDSRVFPAHLGLADLAEPKDAARAASLLEAAIEAVPERAYLAFERLARAYAASGAPSRFVALCESLITRDPRDWRARLALARHLATEARHDEALGLLLRAVEANPQVLVLHIEAWKTLRGMGVASAEVDRYLQTADEAVFYRDPHICTACRYRADDMLWRCPHCHEWNTFVEERVGAAAGAGPRF